MRNVPVLAIKCEMLFMNFFERKLVKSMYLKIIRLIRVMLAVQRLAAYCLESVSLTRTYRPPPSCKYLLTRLAPVVSLSQFSRVTNCGISERLFCFIF
jgi:hypothetical protein